MSDPEVAAPAHAVSFREAAGFWIKLGFINFGGPAGQIALMHEELVERRRWITEGRFLHALNYCMLLPGPEAQQLAIYVGWLLHKVRGGLLAGIAFILPAFFLIWGLSWTYAAHGDVAVVNGLFLGLQAAVVGIVAHRRDPDREESVANARDGRGGGRLVPGDLRVPPDVPGDHPGRGADRGRGAARLDPRSGRR